MSPVHPMNNKDRQTITLSLKAILVHQHLSYRYSTLFCSCCHGYDMNYRRHSSYCLAKYQANKYVYCFSHSFSSASIFLAVKVTVHAYLEHINNINSALPSAPYSVLFWVKVMQTSVWQRPHHDQHVYGDQRAHLVNLWAFINQQ